MYVCMYSGIGTQADAWRRNEGKSNLFYFQTQIHWWLIQRVILKRVGKDTDSQKSCTSRALPFTRHLEGHSTLWSTLHVCTVLCTVCSLHTVIVQWLQSRYVESRDTHVTCHRIAATIATDPAHGFIVKFIQLGSIMPVCLLDMRHASHCLTWWSMCTLSWITWIFNELYGIYHLRLNNR